MSAHRPNKQQSAALLLTTLRQQHTTQLSPSERRWASKWTCTCTHKMPLHVTGKSKRQTKAGGSLPNECFGAEPCGWCNDNTATERVTSHQPDSDVCGHKAAVAAAAASPERLPAWKTLLMLCHVLFLFQGFFLFYTIEAIRPRKRNNNQELRVKSAPQWLHCYSPTCLQ